MAVSGFHRARDASSSPDKLAERRPSSTAAKSVRPSEALIVKPKPRIVLRQDLRPLVPILVEAMERHGHLQLAGVRDGLVSMSAATIDQALWVKEATGARVGFGTSAGFTAQRAGSHFRWLE